jgi:hypothetical protein
MKAHRGSRGIVLLFFNLGARWRWVVNAMPRPLYHQERHPVPIVQEAGWGPGPVCTGAKNLAPTGIWSRDRPARSESLYRLRYSWPQRKIGSKENQMNWSDFVTIQWIWLVRQRRASIRCNRLVCGFCLPDAFFTSGQKSYTPIKGVTRHLPLYASLTMSLLPFHVTNSLSLHLSTYLPTHPPTYLSIYLSTSPALSYTGQLPEAANKHNLHNPSNTTASVFPHLDPLQANTPGISILLGCVPASLSDWVSGWGPHIHRITPRDVSSDRHLATSHRLYFKQSLKRQEVPD